MINYDHLSNEEAMKLIASLYEKVYNKPATRETTWGTSKDPTKNTPLRKLAGAVRGGGRRRIIGWLQSKVQPKDEMDAMEKIYQKAFELMKSRNQKYGDSWKVLNIPALANLCEMKLHRIANMGQIDPKTEDELIDTINYCVFGLYKLSQQASMVMWEAFTSSDDDQWNIAS